MLLDGPHLLAQEKLALSLIDRLLRLLTDFAGKAEHLEPSTQQLENLIHPGFQIEGLQQLLPLLRLQLDEARHEVGQQRRCGHALHGAEGLGRSLRRQLQRLRRPLAQLDRPRLDLRRHLVGGPDHLDPGAQVGASLQELDDPEPIDALRDDVVGIVGGSDVTEDVGDGADPVEVFRAGGLDFRAPLQDHPQRLLPADRLLRRRDGCAAAEDDRQDHAGKQHQVANRQENERIIRRLGHRLGPATVASDLCCPTEARPTCSVEFAEGQEKTASGQFASDQFQSSRRCQPQPSLEASVRNLEAVDQKAVRHCLQRPAAGYDHRFTFDQQHRRRRVRPRAGRPG